MASTYYSYYAALVFQNINLGSLFGPNQSHAIDDNLKGLPRNKIADTIKKFRVLSVSTRSMNCWCKISTFVKQHGLYSTKISNSCSSNIVGVGNLEMVCSGVVKFLIYFCATLYVPTYICPPNNPPHKDACFKML